MPVDARRLVRKMRGGAQAHLLEGSDGNCYVVKFSNNPQHRRILVNEWIASVFLRHLGLSSPEVAMVRISEEFLEANTDVYLQLGRERRAPELGWHFGSRFPGEPERMVVYDFLPDALLDKVENAGEFVGVLAFDKWASNADSRQAIFFRARVRDQQEERLGFIAQMVDNGYVFDGPHWRLEDSPIQGLYFRPLVYSGVRGLADFEPWLERIRHFPEEVVDQAVKQLPPAWLDGEEADLERLLDRLLSRRKRVADLIQDCRAGRADPFPAWV
ncbi:MAG TPA: HipA family kinase [Bryobacteraceae bacterium]|jgi:hypothetical protein